MSLEEYRFATAVQKELRAQLDVAKAEATEHWEDLKFTVTQRDNARSERDELLAMLKRILSLTKRDDQAEALIARLEGGE